MSVSALPSCSEQLIRIHGFRSYSINQGTLRYGNLEERLMKPVMSQAVKA